VSEWSVVRWYLSLGVLMAAIVAGLAGWWLTDVRDHVITEARERALKPKDTFKECTGCPEMVVVPAANS
jgi:hypothetical protein